MFFCKKYMHICELSHQTHMPHEFNFKNVHIKGSLAQNAMYFCIVGCRYSKILYRSKRALVRNHMWRLDWSVEKKTKKNNRGSGSYPRLFLCTALTSVCSLKGYVLKGGLIWNIALWRLGSMLANGFWSLYSLSLNTDHARHHPKDSSCCLPGCRVTY